MAAASNPSTAPTILLVEDNLADQEMIRRAVARVQPELDLVVVDDGEQALDYLFRQDTYADVTSDGQPDLVLLDLNLPKVSGREVLKTIRGTPSLAHIPVIVLSTTQFEDDILDCYRLGCNSYLSKPSRFDVFLTTMTTIVEYWFNVVFLPPKI